jgi:uridylate kinase
MKTILLKLSGQILRDPALARDLGRQLVHLNTTHTLGIVVGGGNFFRGSREGKTWGLSATAADGVGMLATVMNGLILRDIFAQQSLESIVLGPCPLPGLVQAISQEVLDHARDQKKVVIFVGGTGNPFFTTDTAAIVRGLQLGADQIWKATDVDFVYDNDPDTHPDAKPLAKLTYDQALKNNLRIMDQTAFALAREHNVKIRIFNVFEKDALLNVAQNPNIGSWLSA